LDVRGVQLIALALLALLTVAASIVGDLIESLMKRHAQVKDSGSIFPGHGGLMDRLDSVFAALPVFAAGLLLLGV
ncbi:MAG: phosphatidate cytidylyltransferase, partial [Rhodanobacter sp.]